MGFKVNKNILMYILFLRFKSRMIQKTIQFRVDV